MPKSTIAGFVVLLPLLMTVSGWALEPETLFNFQVGPVTIDGTLVQGPDGNFPVAGLAKGAISTASRPSAGGQAAGLFSKLPMPAH